MLDRRLFLFLNLLRLCRTEPYRRWLQPISTRYIAKRVDVTVVASDETRSAITGDFTNYGYVIATSSGPINSGEQVKLIES